MTREIGNLVFRRNARRRKIISSTGWVIILIAVFAVTAIVAFSVSSIAHRDVYSLATPLPATIRPTAVSWALDKQVLPGGTQVYTAPEYVKRQAVSAFIEAWNSIGFQSGVPEDADAQELLAQHFWQDSPAYKGAAEIVTTARQAGAYWRREIVGQISLSSLVEFSQTGDQARFSFGLPASSVRNELVDARSGKVIASQAQDAVLTVVVRYDTAVKRWKVYEIQTTKH